jgi:pyruvate/2-oxoglutarate dehydrogenase complex dihydrolipoamide acyltransferase (E2) component
MAIFTKSNVNEIPVPKLRRAVVDFCAFGNVKNVVHMQFDLDVTSIYDALKTFEETQRVHIKFNAYLLWLYSRLLEEYPIFNTYIYKNNFIQFEDVDITIPVEKEIGDPSQGLTQPFLHTFRKANQMNLLEINEELKSIKNKTIEEIMPNLNRKFYTYSPSWLRKIFWRMARKNPHVMKNFVGTTLFTTVGMFGTGAIYPFPIGCLTANIAFGSIDEKFIMIDGKIVQRNFLSCVLAVDHDIIDGAPLMRFIQSFKEKVNQCWGLQESIHSVRESTSRSSLVSS